MAENIAEEVKDLKETFENMDTDRSGTITCEELKTGLARIGSELSVSSYKSITKA
jgi:calcium-dependent protein kinase